MPGRRSKAPTVRRTPARKSAAQAGGFDALAQAAVAQLLNLQEPADQWLRRFFAANPAMGRSDRGQLAEMAYDILRNRRLYAHLAQSAQGNLAQRLIAMHRAREQVLAQDLSPAVRLSLPDWLFERLAAQWSPEQLQTQMQAMLCPAPLDLRVNLLKCEPAAAAAALAEQGIEAQSLPIAPLALRVRGKPALEKTSVFRDGWVEVQDAGSQLLAHLVAPRRGQTVIDFCAGAGGKTLALAALLRGTGQVFACDISAARLARLRPRLARSGATNVQPFGIDHERDPKLLRLAGRADLVLVDAPCSGLGTLRRNPDLKWRLEPAALASLAQTQRAILHAAAALLRPGGALVYATCSLLAEENQAVRDDFQRAHPDWELEDAQEVLARQGIRPEGAFEDGALVLGPAAQGTDGFYAVRWRRPAG